MQPRPQFHENDDVRRTLQALCQGQSLLARDQSPQDKAAVLRLLRAIKWDSQHSPNAERAKLLGEGN